MPGAEIEKGHGNLAAHGTVAEVSIFVTRSVPIPTSRLVDHRIGQERWASRCRERRQLPRAFGEFMAGLAEWNWFMNPISFRVEPVSDAAIAAIVEFFALVRRQAVRPIGWVIAEEFGRLGGRLHCHALVSGVGNLQRTFWWREAFRRFGYTKILPFDPGKGAAFYAAKYSAKQLGNLHFGGTLAGIELRSTEQASMNGGGQDTVSSVELPKSFFRLGLKRWHR